MLYTTMPWELIFPVADGEAPRVREAQIDGKACSIRQQDDGSLRIERLFSTDPADFLDERYAPNTLVDWRF